MNVLAPSLRKAVRISAALFLLVLSPLAVAAVSSLFWSSFAQDNGPWNLDPARDAIAFFDETDPLTGYVASGRVDRHGGR